MRLRIGLLAVPLLALALAACGNDDGRPGDPAPTTEAKAGVKVAESDLGPILVDQSGRTLYAFTKDKDQTSNCDDACIAVWPALTTTAAVATSDGANASLIGLTKHSDSVQQATYGGWPLYYYVGDEGAGDVSGQGIDDEWFVLSPDGKLVKTTA